jgi:phosphate butyryltransferase
LQKILKEFFALLRNKRDRIVFPDHKSYMNLKRLDELIVLARERTKRRLVVAAAQDIHVLQAVCKANAEKIVDPVLIGNKNQIGKMLKDLNTDPTHFELVDEPDPESACDKAVKLIKKRKADILMKGLVPTATFLKAILNKENGIRKQELLSHFALFEIPTYHKLIGITDAAMNICPDLNEKVSIIKNAIEVYHRLGIKEPKVAVIGPLEVVNPKIESTVHASMLAMMNRSKQIDGCIIDGPLALDNAVSKEAAELKGIKGEVAGDADIIVTPDLNSGNILYKSLIFLGNSISAAIIMGAISPVVLTSRADSEISKYMSIVLAAAMD